MATIEPLVDDAEFAPSVSLPARRMTEEEFVAWCPERLRAEWVDGEVIVMSPVNLGHARLATFLIRLLSEFIEHHDLGEVLGTEFAVRLTGGQHPQRRIPDLLFVAKEHLDRLRPNHLEGPPDLILEIVSPESVARDWREKYLDYQANGVREYWVVDPQSRRVEAYALAEGRYRRLEEAGGRISSEVLPGFFLKPEWLWRSPLPRVLDVLRELGVLE